MAGIDPKLWGKAIWDSMHWVAAGFPDTPNPDDRKNYRVWFMTIMNVLPCNECRHHAIQILRTNPPKVDSRAVLFEWTVDIHNELNKILGAPGITLEDARKRYELDTPTQETQAPIFEVPIIGLPGSTPAPAPVSKQAPVAAPAVQQVATVAAQPNRFRHIVNSNGMLGFVSPVNFSQPRMIQPIMPGTQVGQFRDFGAPRQTVSAAAPQQTRDLNPSAPTQTRDVTNPAPRKRGCGCGGRR